MKEKSDGKEVKEGGEFPKLWRNGYKRRAFGGGNQAMLDKEGRVVRRRTVGVGIGRTNETD